MMRRTSSSRKGNRLSLCRGLKSAASRACAAAAALGIMAAGASAQAPANIDAILQTAMTKNKVPAVAAVVVHKRQVIALGAVGVRKSGDPTPVTRDDQFHLGSCTKAMTGTLAGILVDGGKLKWTTTLAEVFPELASTMRPEYRAVTLDQLLAHRAGLPTSNRPGVASLRELYDTGKLAGAPRKQRTDFIGMILADPPQNKPGSAYLYSNRSFVLVGAMIERVADKPYEDLMEKQLFKPLGITTAGWGAMGTPGKLDQPWQHRFYNNEVTLLDPGHPWADLPPIMNPAGTCHLSAGDWGRFLALHASGESGAYAAIIKPATLKHLHTPPFGGSYMAGWIIQQGGKVLTHNGSNMANYSYAWVCPEQELAIGAMTNEGGMPGAKACDNTFNPLMTRFSGTASSAPTTAPSSATQ